MHPIYAAVYRLWQRFTEMRAVAEAAFDADPTADNQRRMFSARAAHRAAEAMLEAATAADLESTRKSNQ